MAHSERIEFRLRPDAKRMIAEAARVLGMDTSDFARDVLLERAGEVLAEHEVKTVVPASLDRWLRDHALAAQQRGHSRVLGGMVLAEALGRVAHVADQVGVRFLVVDALNQRAATFYERYGFQRVPDRESMRLLLRISPDLLTC